MSSWWLFGKPYFLYPNSAGWTRVSFDGNVLCLKVGETVSRANLDTVSALIFATSLTSRAETLDKSQEKIQPPAAAGTTILRFISEHQFRRLTLCTSERKCALVLMKGLADIFMYFHVVSRHTFLPVSATNHCCTCLMLVSGTSLFRFSIFPCPLL